MYTIYILECADKTLYTGITTDLERRFREHVAGTASHYTRAKKAKRIIAIETAANRSSALKREAAIKRLSREQKMLLVTQALKKDEIKPRFFVSGKEFRCWLKSNAAKRDEVWLGFYKKSAAKKGINYAEALDEALCFGWIDGLKKTYSSEAYRLRFTPRRQKSIWSVINREHIQRLMKLKKMTALGLKEVERAKADGRWQSAYSPVSRSTVPDDLASALTRHTPSAAFFAGLNSANRYAILYRLQTAKKPETRARRLLVILKMLRDKKTFH